MIHTDRKHMRTVDLLLVQLYNSKQREFILFIYRPVVDEQRVHEKHPDQSVFEMRTRRLLDRSCSDV